VGGVAVSNEWEATMCPTKLPAVYAKIKLQVDVDKRTARLEMPALISSKGRPIRNPVTGAVYRVRKGRLN